MNKINKDSLLRILIVSIVVYTSFLVLLIAYFALSGNVLSGIYIPYQTSNPVNNQPVTPTEQTPVSAPTSYIQTNF